MRNQPKVALRVPPDLKDWVQRRAEQNHRSMNSEIEHCLMKAREAEKATQAAGGPMARAELEA